MLDLSDDQMDGFIWSPSGFLSVSYDNNHPIAPRDCAIDSKATIALGNGSF